MKIIFVLLVSLFITSTCYADKYVLYDKVNEVYVNDFQTEATPDTLIKNNIEDRDINEFEIQKVSDEEFIRLEKEANDQKRQEKEAEFKAKQFDDDIKKNAILKKLGITKEEAELLK